MACLRLIEHLLNELDVVLRQAHHSRPRVAVRSAVRTALARTSRGAPELGTNLSSRSKVKIMRSRVRYQASAIEARESGTTEVRVLDLVPRFGHRLPSLVMSRNAALALGARVRRVSDWSVRAFPQQMKRSGPAANSQRNGLDTFGFAVQVQKESNTLMGRLRKRTLFICKIPLQHQRDSFMLQSKILATTVVTVVQHKLLSEHLREQRSGVSKCHRCRTEKLMSFHYQGFLGTRTVGDRPMAVSNESKIMKLTGRPACSVSWRLRSVSPSCSIC